MALEDLAAWTFVCETTPPSVITELLIPGEEAVAAYKTLRDTAVITNKRLIVADKQGITGKKVEIYTIPFKNIEMYSTENAGFLDFSSELELWTRSGKIKIKLNRGVDIRKLDRLIAQYIL